MRCAAIAIGLVVASTAVVQDSSADEAPSAAEVAAKLANPNKPLASLTLKLQFRTFQGNLPNADDQNGTTLLFQPSFPFSLANGDVVFFRPAIPIQFNQPAFNSGASDFDSEAGLGDIAFDIAYGRMKKSGLILAAGFPDWSWGAGAGAWLNEGNTWYASGTINDANGTITNESFFDGGAEFFKQVEVG